MTVETARPCLHQPCCMSILYYNQAMLPFKWFTDSSYNNSELEHRYWFCCGIAAISAVLHQPEPGSCPLMAMMDNDRQKVIGMNTFEDFWWNSWTDHVDMIVWPFAAIGWLEAINSYHRSIAQVNWEGTNCTMSCCCLWWTFVISTDDKPQCQVVWSTLWLTWNDRQMVKEEWRMNWQL